MAIDSNYELSVLCVLVQELTAWSWTRAAFAAATIETPVQLGAVHRNVRDSKTATAAQLHAATSGCKPRVVFAGGGWGQPDEQCCALARRCVHYGDIGAILRWRGANWGVRAVYDPECEQLSAITSMSQSSFSQTQSQNLLGSSQDDQVRG